MHLVKGTGVRPVDEMRHRQGPTDIGQPFPVPRCRGVFKKSGEYIEVNGENENLICQLTLTSCFQYKGHEGPVHKINVQRGSRMLRAGCHAH